MHNDIRKTLSVEPHKPITDMCPCQIREAFDSMAETLSRALGPDVVLSIHAQPGLPQVYADASMIETLLMNLAVNARDAMPEGGQLNLSAQAVELDAPQAAAHRQARPGRFICITICDTGCGMSAETLPQIFEPSFTTKTAGQGAGLGLSTVQGIVKQHRGWIETQSELGKGSIFRIYIPVIDNQQPAAQPRDIPLPAASAPLKKPSETILVVEDEPDLRELVTQLLQSRGYKTVSAGTGAQALEQWARHKDQIQLVLTDMIMPDGMTGRNLAERLLAQAPQLPIIYTSGYSPGTNRLDVGHIDPDHFLGKPYRPADLFEIVRRCLTVARPTIEQAA
jgi:CheY-like chemotaxis protein